MRIRKSGENYVVIDSTGDYFFHDVNNDINNPLWKLMYYFGPGGNNQIIISGKFDNNGQYTSINIKQGNMIRCFGINPAYHDEIGYDVIELRNNDERVFPDKNYISVPDSILKPGEKIKDYFQKKHEFVTYSGEKYEGILSSNYLIIDFMKANKKLSPIVTKCVARRNNDKSIYRRV